jgi:hypothetical protein
MQVRSNKRQKEKERQEKQREKDARRAERKKEKSEKPKRLPGEPDPDLAGIVPGPQPLPEEEGGTAIPKP